MGFYPLPEGEGANLRHLLSLQDGIGGRSLRGQGVALNLITEGATWRRYGVELRCRASAVCKRQGDRDDPGNTFDAVAKPDPFRSCT